MNRCTAPLALLLCAGIASPAPSRAADCDGLLARIDRLERVADHAFTADEEPGHPQGVQCGPPGVDGSTVCFFTHGGHGAGHRHPLLFSIVARRGVVARATRTELSRLCAGRGCLPSDFIHPGGIQLAGDLLAVGLEPDATRSRVLFLDVSDPRKPVLLPGAIRREPVPGHSRSAGAVALAAHDGALWVAVGNWDSQTVDLYRTRESELRSGNEPRPVGEVALDGASHQALQFVVDGPRLLLAGLYTAAPWLPSGTDRVDVFAVREQSDARAHLEACGSRRIDLHAGLSWGRPRLLYAGGLALAGDRIELFAMARRLSEGRILVLRERR